MSFNKLWDGQLKTRAIERRLEKLTSVGRAAGSHISDLAATTASEEAFNVHNALQTRHAVMNEVQYDFVKLCLTHPLSEETLKVVNQAPKPLLVKIFLQSLNSLVVSLTPDGATPALRACGALLSAGPEVPRLSFARCEIQAV